MARHPKPPSQTWRTFLDNHVGCLASIDFFVVPTAPERSWRFHRSAGSIIGTSCLRPEHRWVPFEGSRVAMKTPPGSPWIRRHFPPRQERCRWQADKSKRRFRKTPCLLRGEKRVAADGEGSVGGPDEIKRRDSAPRGELPQASCRNNGRNFASPEATKCHTPAQADLL